MQYRRLGKSGLKLSELSFGSWVTFGNQLDVRNARECMTAAYDAGVNFFDNAEVYAAGESEIVMGKVLKETGWHRDTFCVSSKVFWGGKTPTQNGLSRKHVTDACHAALKRLQVEYLDLYFCHRPDPETPIEETARAMSDLVKQGKILYWGTSEWSAEQIQTAYTLCRELQLEAPTMEQPEYNLFHRTRVEEEFAPLYAKYGMGTTTWSPLASGILTGKYNDGIPAGSRMTLSGYEWLRARLETPEGQRKVAHARRFSDIARGMGATASQFAIAWCLKNPNVSTVILGASNATQLKETLVSWEFANRLDSEILSRVDKILQN